MPAHYYRKVFSGISGRKLDVPWHRDGMNNNFSSLPVTICSALDLQRLLYSVEEQALSLDTVVPKGR